MGPPGERSEASAPRVAFLGSKRLGLGVFDEIRRLVEPVGVLCPDDESDARSTLPEFRQRLSVTIADRASDVASLLRSWRPDAVIVAGWYRRLPVEELRETPFYGIHASPLPRYRGGAPLVWQIIAGEPKLGLSLFRMGEGLDDGPIVGQAERRLEVSETIADAVEWAEEASRELMRQHLTSIVEGRPPLVEQDHTAATWCAQRLPEDGRIDWALPARRVHDFIRAQARPYPGAFSTLAGKSFPVWRSEIDPRGWLGTPGAVVEPGVVACGEGALRILEAGVALDSVRLRLG